ncbi:MAG: L-threonylcarbamoyladenylate synthase [Candidatus Undinarchaeales archaeon]|jgi:L-threonylcarbamoyladenylate synthase|nr:L-threonylcarbamoyladenylate synthase [Candidatus Undinarchaeales archaeon]
MDKLYEAIKVLREGGVIVYPTETVYGLGANIFNEDAVKKVYALKGRKFDKPLSVAMRREDMNEYGVVSDTQLIDLELSLPGPVTIVARKKKIPDWITNTDFVGMRVPEHPDAYELVSRFGPITSTSANKAGGKSPISVDEIPKSILDKVDYVIDDGETKYKQGSTVIKVTDSIEILREGAWKKK